MVDMESIACTVKFDTPIAAGTPEISPVLGFRDNPRGSEPETIDHV
jgi:hypothetical protein